MPRGTVTLEKIVGSCFVASTMVDAEPLHPRPALQPGRMRPRMSERLIKDAQLLPRRAARSHREAKTVTSALLRCPTAPLSLSNPLTTFWRRERLRRGAGVSPARSSLWPCLSRSISASIRFRVSAIDITSQRKTNIISSFFVEPVTSPEVGEWLRPTSSLAARPT